MAVKQCFLPQKGVRPLQQQIFWLAENRMPYYHSNTVLLYAYGEAVSQAGFQQEVHHPFWTFSYVVEGWSEMMCPGQVKVQAGPGNILILRPGQKYTMSVRKGIQKRKVLLFNGGSLLTVLCGQGGLADTHVARPADPARFAKSIEKIRSLVVDGDVSLYEEVAKEGYGFLHELVVQTSPPQAMEDFDRIIDDIGDNITQEWSLKMIAERYNSSIRTINRLFHSHVNCSPMEFIINVRMSQAARQLKDTNLPIKIIAESCGYKNRSLFAKTFSKKYSMTPKQYRSNSR